MSEKRGTAFSDAGFSIAEYVIAISILFIVLMAVMGGLAFASTSTASAAKRETALNVANERMERARNLPYDDLGVRYSDGTYGNPPGELVSPEQVGEFTVKTRVTWARDKTTNRSTCKTIYVTVEWQRPRPGSLTIESSITGKSTITNAGDVLIKLYDVETTKPITGATIDIKPSMGVVRRLSTDKDGEAFFGYVPQGALAITATKSGYVFDMSGLTGATVAADSLSQYAAPGMMGSTGKVLVRSTLGAAIPNATLTVTGPSGTFNATSDSQGYAQFPNLYRGDYQVQASAPGYQQASTTFKIVSGGSTVDSVVSLAPVGQVLVKVVDDDGTAVPGATVSVTSQSTGANVPGSPGTSSSSGECSFNLAGGGSYAAAASKAGYTVAPAVPFSVTAGQQVTVTVTLVPVTSGSIRVYLVDRQGALVKNAKVNLYNSSGYNQQLYTDNTGSALFTGLAVGTYQAKAVYRPNSTVTTSASPGTETRVTVVTRIN